MDASKWVYGFLALVVTAACLYVSIVEGFINRRIGLGGKTGPQSVSYIVGNNAVITGVLILLMGAFLLSGLYKKFNDDD